MGSYRPGDEYSVGLVNLDKLMKTTWLFDLVRKYFQYEAKGVERIPARGPAVVVLNHGLLAVDGVLLGLEIFRETGRVLRGLAAHWVFGIPLLRDLFLAAGVVDGNRVTADELLARGELVAVMPGGVREACKPSTERYRLKWEGRTGFVSMALRHSAPIVPAACVGTDELYYVFNDGARTGRAFGLKSLPIPLFVGLGPLPLPARLTHYIGGPIDTSQAKARREDPETVLDVQKEVKRSMEELLERGLRERQDANPPRDGWA
jgi:1-acyl-sn-glycerol-3-phosphate acyltransferase